MAEGVSGVFPPPRIDQAGGGQECGGEGWLRNGEVGSLLPQGIWTSTSHRLTSFDLIIFGCSVSPPGAWILALPCDAALRNIPSFFVLGVELLLEFDLGATAHSQGSGCQRDGVCARRP